MHSTKNGFVLIMVMVFIVLAMIGTYSLYMLVSSNYSVVGTNTAANTEGYYAAVAGLRYAPTMLNDLYLAGNVPASNASVTKSMKNDYAGTLYANLGLTPPHDVTITIKNNGDGTYSATASYN